MSISAEATETPNENAPNVEAAESADDSTEVHVIAVPTGWAVGSADDVKEHGVFSTRREAIQVGRETAREESGHFFLHARGGKVLISHEYDA